MIRTLLVPLDGSPFGEQALPYALAIVRRSGGSIHLVHAHDVDLAAWILPMDTWDLEIRERERAYLSRIVDGLTEELGRAPSAALRDGDPVDVIEAEAAEIGADLVVMTTHARGGLERAWLGSVADGLVRRGGIPLLLVRPVDRAAPPDGGALLAGPILVPLDESELSEGVLEPAAALARIGSGRMVLLHVVPPSLEVAGHVFRVDEARLEEASARAESYLEGVAGRLRREGLEVAVRVVAHEAPAAAILEAAAAEGAGVVAMSTHGRSGLGRLVLGSVADKVIRSARLPVLVMRPEA
jgi:nucleotide-binding universal stress UspA family protein